ncbi:MAG TPA: hypothetical protein VL307_15785, partial [Chitinophagaceae bacterium]|nr:hypothetical protein [Chitinophagaceae bacterium]
MHPNFTLSPASEFTRSTGFHSQYHGLRVPGATVISAVHPVMGSMVLQQLQGKQYSLFFQVFDIRTPCTLLMEHPPSF